jgi:hypothetical protein
MQEKTGGDTDTETNDYNIVTYLHYKGHPLPRSDVTGDTTVTTQR